jgi:hypothetical protein
MHADLTVC